MVFRSLFFALSLLVYAVPIPATTVVERSFSDLVHRAETITVGTVSDIREQWDDIQQAPLTAVTFSDLTILKGQAHTGSLTLLFLGGPTPQGTYLSIPGMPRFTVGEKNVVFSAANGRDFCPLVGLWQGRLRVVQDLQRGIETVRDNFRVPIVGIRNGRFLKQQSNLRPEDALPLPTLIQLIQQELQRSDGQP